MRRLHILLAEDNEGDVLLIREALQQHNIPHDLHLMTDGERVLQFLSVMGTAAGPPCPDVFLLDLNLPKVDGADVLRSFRNDHRCATTPVIVITSSDAPKDREKMATLQVSAYFKKPFDFDAYMQLGDLVVQAVADPRPSE